MNANRDVRWISILGMDVKRAPLLENGIGVALISTAQIIFGWYNHLLLFMGYSAGVTRRPVRLPATRCDRWNGSITWAPNAFLRTAILPCPRLLAVLFSGWQDPCRAKTRVCCYASAWRPND